MAAASLEDLQEIAEGKGSARDMQEAGVKSVSEARRLINGRHGSNVHTTHKRRKVHRAVARRK